MGYATDMLAKLRELQKKDGIKYFGPGIPDDYYTDGSDMSDEYYQHILDNPPSFDVDAMVKNVRNWSHFYSPDYNSKEDYIEYLLSLEGASDMKKKRIAYDAEVAEAKRRGLVPGGNGVRVCR